MKRIPFFPFFFSNSCSSLLFGFANHQMTIFFLAAKNESKSIRIICIIIFIVVIINHFELVADFSFASASARATGRRERRAASQPLAIANQTGKQRLYCQFAAASFGSHVGCGRRRPRRAPRLQTVTFFEFFLFFFSFCHLTMRSQLARCSSIDAYLCERQY